MKSESTTVKFIFVFLLICLVLVILAIQDRDSRKAIRNPDVKDSLAEKYAELK